MNRDDELIKLKLQEVALLEREIKLREELPHLHGFKFYKWAREFFEAKNKLGNFLVAANQVSKSSTQIRKCIHWATEKNLWPELWPHLRPNQFWYLYPNKDTATAEFKTKWSQFLPAGSMKDDPKYGWKPEWDNKKILAIHFNSGVSVYFKTYAQNEADLQSGSVFAMFLDEEVPVDLLPELQNRLNATDGYFNLVFTATLGQEHWRKCIEPKYPEEETHPGAFKRQVSLYDCLTYEDGTPSHWTMERILRIIAKQPTELAVAVRVHGKFAKIGGRKIESYDEMKNRTDKHPLPKDWLIYAGVDIGSGESPGKRAAHLSAICFVAVSPDFKRGRVFRFWRGDGQQTTAGDVLVKYIEMKGDLDVTQAFYDFASAEFKIIAERSGETFYPADKSHATGEGILNTLFKAQMLALQRDDVEIDKLSGELMSVLASTSKTAGGDDGIDSLRYATSKIPWDFSSIEGLPVESPVIPKVLTEIDRRRAYFEGVESDEILGVEEEFDEWNELYQA